MPTKQKPSLKTPFKEYLIAKIDDYMDQAFASDDPAKRQNYREAIKQMEQLLLVVSELE